MEIRSQMLPMKTDTQSALGGTIEGRNGQESVYCRSCKIWYRNLDMPGTGAHLVVVAVAPVGAIERFGIYLGGSLI